MTIPIEQPGLKPPASPVPTFPATGGSDRPAEPTRPVSIGLVVRPDTPRSIRIEITIVLLVTLGLSGLRSIVDIIETQIQAAQQHVAISTYVVSVAAPQSKVSVFIDFLRQILGIVQQLSWGFLGLYLLWRAGVKLSDRLGLNLRRPRWDALMGLGLAAVIGIPGLFLYLIANHLGYALTVQGSTLPDVWWRTPVSILLAFENGFLEEVLVVGYLLTRLEHLRTPIWAAVAFSAVLRGSYHLYQGYGGFVGNAVMGLIFALVFLRWRRLWPLVFAHTLIDSIVFVAYPLLKGHVSWLP